jgi:hypothetical protein
MKAGRMNQITINIKDGTLFCPHCGEKLHALKEECFFSHCPHTVFAYVWDFGHQDFWEHVRPDYAKSLLDTIMSSQVYINAISANEIEPISDDIANQFIASQFEPSGDVSERIIEYVRMLANHSESATDILTKNIADNHTLIFEDMYEDCGSIIAIDYGI